MSLVLRLTAAMFGGFALHRLYEPVGRLPERWASMIREAIGIAGMSPFLLLVHHAVGDIKNQDERITISYYMAALFFGAGVFLGHLYDTWVEAL